MSEQVRNQSHKAAGEWNEHHRPGTCLRPWRGTGKTSVLSAIEMAFSGEVAADSDYVSHLPYRDSNGGRIVLSVTDFGPGNGRKGIDMRVTVNGLHRKPRAPNAQTA